ncbi:MAG: hypothetical protein BWY79_02016 [Actinobacteria bacterium ADurb.Bin444]|nr:MAG: hypothetical protein BWY79_02016 [Actinobacteria bacterium ADurb.Bin444]
MTEGELFDVALELEDPEAAEDFRPSWPRAIICGDVRRVENTPHVEHHGAGVHLFTPYLVANGMPCGRKVIDKVVVWFLVRRDTPPVPFNGGLVGYDERIPFIERDTRYAEVALCNSMTEEEVTHLRTWLDAGGLAAFAEWLGTSELAFAADPLNLPLREDLAPPDACGGGLEGWLKLTATEARSGWDPFLGDVEAYYNLTDWGEARPRPTLATEDPA